MRVVEYDKASLSVKKGVKSMTVSIIEAKQNLETLLHQVALGESVVITLEGQQFEVIAKPKKLRGGWGSLPGWKMSDDFNEPLEEMKEYME